MSHDHLFSNALRFPMARAAAPDAASHAIIHHGRREWSIIVSLNR